MAFNGEIKDSEILAKGIPLGKYDDASRPHDERALWQQRCVITDNHITRDQREMERVKAQEKEAAAVQKASEDARILAVKAGAIVILGHQAVVAYKANDYSTEGLKGDEKKLSQVKPLKAALNELGYTGSLTDPDGVLKPHAWMKEQAKAILIRLKISDVAVGHAQQGGDQVGAEGGGDLGVPVVRMFEDGIDGMGCVRIDFDDVISVG